MTLAELHFSDVEGDCFVHHWSLTQSFDLPRCCLGSVPFANLGSSVEALVPALNVIRYHMLRLDQPGLRQPCFSPRSYLQGHWLA